MTHLRLTTHAIARWRERVGHNRDSARAGAELAAAQRHAWKLDRRIAHQLIPRLTLHRDSGRTIYYIAPSSPPAMLLCRGSVIVTVLPLTEEQLADLVVWSIWGRLPDRVQRRTA